MTIKSKLIRCFYVLFITGICTSQLYANQLTPRPTPFPKNSADRSDPIERELSSFRLPVLAFEGVRLEALSNNRFVFSDTEGFDKNRRLYYWQSGLNDLVDTELDGLPRSVIMPEDGRYMRYLYSELDANSDINNDGVTDQTLLRFYHFATARHITIGVPARSGEEEVKEIPEESQSKREFEYFLRGDDLLYSVSSQLNNGNDSSQQLRADWRLVDMNQVVYQITGTPTPTPTPTLSTPTATGFPTVPPELRTSADLNNDDIVDTLDLLLFQLFWRESTIITPTPTIAF